MVEGGSHEPGTVVDQLRRGYRREIRCCSRREMTVRPPGALLHRRNARDMLILKTLTRGNLHGYAIVQLIQQMSGDEILIEEGSLYPALQRLELHGWVIGEWGLTPNNRRARIYRLTAAGRKQLAHETRRYRKLTLAIARVMGMA